MRIKEGILTCGLLLGLTCSAFARTDCFTVMGARWLGYTSEDVKNGKITLCDEDNDPYSTSLESRTGKLLAGEHDLYRLAEGSSVSGSGVYFLFMGSVDAETSQVVKFLWKTNEGHYQVSVLPATKLRINFKDVETPTIKFRWAPSNIDWSYQQIMDNQVVYAVVTISEKEWGRKFQLLDK